VVSGTKKFVVSGTAPRSPDQKPKFVVFGTKIRGFRNQNSWFSEPHRRIYHLKLCGYGRFLAS
jgi:hypothetical protein